MEFLLIITIVIIIVVEVMIMLKLVVEFMVRIEQFIKVIRVAFAIMIQAITKLVIVIVIVIVVVVVTIFTIKHCLVFTFIGFIVIEK